MFLNSNVCFMNIKPGINSSEHVHILILKRLNSKCPIYPNVDLEPCKWIIFVLYLFNSIFCAA